MGKIIAWCGPHPHQDPEGKPQGRAPEVLSWCGPEEPERACSVTSAPHHPEVLSTVGQVSPEVTEV